MLPHKIQDPLICMNASTGCSEGKKPQKNKTRILAQTTVVVCVLYSTRVIMWLMSFQQTTWGLTEGRHTLTLWFDLKLMLVLWFELPHCLCYILKTITDHAMMLIVICHRCFLFFSSCKHSAHTLSEMALHNNRHKQLPSSSPKVWNVVVVTE